MTEMMQKWVGEQLIAEIAGKTIDPTNMPQIESRSMELCLIWQRNNPEPTQEVVCDQWIECETCKKWRKVTTEVTNAFADKPWFCRLDPALAQLSKPCDKPEESEVAPPPEPPPAVEYQCKSVLWEQWVMDTIGSQRQYRVDWVNHSGKDTVQADAHDQQWPDVAKAWKAKCEAFGDVWPMPRPDVDLTDKAKAYTRKYENGLKTGSINKKRAAPRQEVQKPKRRKADSDEDAAEEEEEYWEDEGDDQDDDDQEDLYY